MNELLQELCDVAERLKTEFRARVNALPTPESPLAELLAELAAADVDTAQHWTRHPHVRTTPFEGFEQVYAYALNPGACKADWHRCCTRRDASIRALIDYARALQSKEAA